ncbi:MAG: hypothetical protein ABEJ02_02990 [Candidatus Paceibacteria bacterium]
MKGQFGSRVGFLVFGVLTIVTLSFVSAELGVDTVNCGDPSDILQQPGENATTVQKVIQPANDLVDVFFGCSSSNTLINGFFVALSAAVILIVLGIAKDLVPFT